MKQVEFDFEPGLLDEFPDFMDCLRSSVYGCGRAFKNIAADLDMSSSELSRKLANDPREKDPKDKVYFPMALLPELMQATGDVKPIYWLMEAFLEDPEAKRKRAADKVMSLLPQIEQALKAANG